jgi:DNA-binding NarL/FixJ family response regulator
MKRSNITVVAADDHKVFMAGIDSLFQPLASINLIGVGYTGDDLLMLIQKYEPDIAFIDLSMKGATTQEIISTVTKNHSATKLIALSMYHDPHEVSLLMQAGLSGYVLKESAFDDVINAVETVLNGKPFISPALSKMIESLPFNDNQVFLTDREKLILTSAAQGHSNKKIGDLFDISERTVRFHLSNCCEKLNANGRSNAIAVALHRHLIELY